MPPLPQGYNGGSNRGGGNQGYGGPQGQGPGGPQGFNGGELPQRRNGDGGDASGYGGPAIPRQLPSNPETQGRPPYVPPVSAPPISAPPAPPYGGRPSVPEQPVSPPAAPQSAASAPPAWPPVADRDAPAPHVPESLAAALDMTAELPRYRPDRSATGSQSQIGRPTNPQSAQPAQGSETPTVAQRAAAAAKAAHEAAAAQAAEAQATAAAQIAAAQAAARQRSSADGDQRFADETMELPIFRELESAWFTTARPSPDTSRPAATSPTAPAPLKADDDLVTTQRFSTGEPARTAAVPQQATSPESLGDDRDLDRERDPATVGAVASNGNGSATNNPWQTAADEGWQAARAATEIPVETTTGAGLPKRTPMAQLVPGGVDRGGNSVQRRTPEAVRGLLSAYHRGVQRGRQSTNPEETSGGQQSSQAGKEHEA
jgi:hypothetical protein